MGPVALQKRAPGHDYSAWRCLEAMRALAPVWAAQLCAPQRPTKAMAGAFEAMARDPNRFRDRAWEPALQLSEVTYAS